MQLYNSMCIFNKTEIKIVIHQVRSIKHCFCQSNVHSKFSYIRQHYTRNYFILHHFEYMRYLNVYTYMLCLKCTMYVDVAKYMYRRCCWLLSLNETHWNGNIFYEIQFQLRHRFASILNEDEMYIS